MQERVFYKIPCPLNILSQTTQAVVMQVLHLVRPGTFFTLIEQPSGSWGFKQPEMKDLCQLLGLCLGR